MIAFVTLLLGLISGVYPIEVTVSGPVASVEFLVDGVVAARTDTPPWKSFVNLGEGLAPHELVARALDAQGAELSRVVQWINLPRPPAEVEIVLENSADGKPVAARLSWQSINNTNPGAISLTFDGAPLVLNTERRATLPKYDLKDVHVLSAEVWFGPGVVGRRDAVFGGEYGSEVSTELTAVPIRLSKRSAPTPAPSALQGRLTRDGAPLSIAAIEEGPGKVIVVNVPGAQRVAERYFWTHGRVEVGGGDRSRLTVIPSALAGMRTEMRFGDDTVVRMIFPSPHRFEGSGIVSDLFDVSRDFGPQDGGLLWLLARATLRAGSQTGPPRIADALAVAGLQAAVENRRRAVVLLLSEGEEDASRYSPEEVRRYLASIRVPLYVWSLYGAKVPNLARWGQVEDVSTIQKLYRAYDKVKLDLETQRIVWVEGRYLPQTLSLTPGSGSIEQVESGEVTSPPRGSP